MNTTNKFDKGSATYLDGVATVTDLARVITVSVPHAVALILGGHDYPPTRVDLLALAAGYKAVVAERDALREELAAARAGGAA